MTINFQVPIGPAGVQGLAPAVFSQVQDHATQQLKASAASFAPVGQSARTEQRQVSGMGPCRDNSCLRRPVSEQPGAIAHPGTNQRLGITKSGDQEPGARAIMLGWDAGLPGLKGGNGQGQAQHGCHPDPSQGPEKRRQGQQAGKQVPFQGAGQHGPVGRPRLIKALKQAGSECAPINNRFFQMQAAQGDAVQNPAPFAVPAAVEPVGVLEAQERLGFAIAGLLPQVSTRVPTPMVPHKSPWSEGDPVAGLLKPPTQIDIVPCLAISRVEAIDFQKDLAAKGHVAAGDVLRYLVAFQNVRGLARRCRHAGRQPAVFRGKVGSAHPRCVRALKLVDQVRQPVGVGKTIRIRVGNDRAGGRPQAGVAGHAQTLVRLMKGTDLGKPVQNRPAVIRGAVVYHNDLVVRVIQSNEGAETFLQGAAAVVRTNHHGNTRGFRQQTRG